jgi:hypothetical protein
MKACTSGVSQSIKTSCQKPQPFSLKEIKKILK